MLCASLIVGLALLTGCARPVSVDHSGPIGDWRYWGGDAGGQRHAELTQITPDNVAALEVAWVYHTGESYDGAGLETMKLPAFEATPLLVDDRLIFCTPRNDVIALHPETGEELWRYRHRPRSEGHYLITCRGVSHDKPAQVAPGSACASRLFMGTVDAWLLALDAATGELCQDFGIGGKVDLLDGLGAIDAGSYKVTSPPAVVDGKVIVGALVEDNIRVDAASGVVRAYDAVSGTLEWAWDPVPPGWQHDVPGEYQKGTPNAWGVFSVDPEHHRVFVPTGNASPDYYSGERRGLDYYASSVVALDSRSGKPVWHFQTVHHDVWDYDVASQPVLFDFPGTNGPVPALAQATKQGFVFIFNRLTGEPLFPVREVPAPRSEVDGMVLSPTQPVPELPEPLLPRHLSVDDMWGFTPVDRAACRRLFSRYRYEGPFTPPSRQGTVMFPANVGAVNWGSLSIDQQRRLLIVNSNRFADIARLYSRGEAEERTAAGHPPLYTVSGSRYAVDKMDLLSPLGAPCNRPPWGALTAIDLQTGKKVWEVPLGTTRDQAPFPVWLRLGVPNQGGPLSTASGLTFIGAATDNYLRAFDSRSGEELWKHRLPAGGQATPMSYRLSTDSRQYVVIAAGGHAYLGTKLGDAIVAFALPSQ